jgi:predicted nucleotide-binding protein
MNINPKLKQLYANLKRLQIGNYLLSDDFNLFLIEKNLEDDWDSISNVAKINIASNKSRVNASSLLIEELEAKLLAFLAKHFNEQYNTFHKLILPLLLNFAQWSNIKLDFKTKASNLDEVEISEINILDFMKGIESIQNSKPTQSLKRQSKESFTTRIKSETVFIVHGHDELAKTEVALFIERLGFKPIILHEQSNRGKKIIEKIEANSDVAFGIVLYTPCDIGTVQGQENHLKPRARQNVVFEHGYLIGKLGRENVCALMKGDIEIPSDMSGVVYTPMDSHKGWHLKIAKEMKACGYPVDMNKL